MSAVPTRTRNERADRSSSSHLGGRLRAVLLSPRTGFRGAMRNGGTAAISHSPVAAFMVLLGGMTTMALWLKLTGLVQIADRPMSETEWGTVLPALGLGGILAVVAYIAWSRLASRFLGGSERGLSTDRLRVAWSFSDFPLAAYASLILPLDLLIVGPEIFSTDRLDGTFAMVWSALSVALLVSAAAWSVYLFVRGVEVAAGHREGAVFPLVFFAAIAVWIFYLLLLIKELFA